METIENNRLKITINPLGGILTSIFFKDVNKEMEYPISNTKLIRAMALLEKQL